ncbi:GDNF family receptor alpha-1 [Triplophysa tibetana]|uniref:GDNF family receptor alpha-1 n=1 Tax=Triplophysa tibetana TaxID=1572043 RepID=A0A5A9P7J5_9TELE|nr:GDNF family receptor alpha-1 [Triplophysa tibetana]
MCRGRGCFYQGLDFIEMTYVVLSGEESFFTSGNRLDCVKANELCLKEPGCSTKYRTMRQCVAGREGNFSMVTGVEAKDECRLALDALKQSPLYNCRCKRGMKKEKNCLRIYWGIYQHLQGNDLLEDSPYEPVNSRLSDIFRLAPIYSEPSLMSTTQDSILYNYTAGATTCYSGSSLPAATFPWASRRFRRC